MQVLNRDQLDALRMEALFVSPLQPSQRLTADIIAGAIHDAVRLYHAAGLAEITAGEFGDHPIESVARMSWVRDTLARLSAAAGRVHDALAAMDRLDLDDAPASSSQSPAVAANVAHLRETVAA